MRLYKEGHFLHTHIIRCDRVSYVGYTLINQLEKSRLTISQDLWKDHSLIGNGLISAASKQMKMMAVYISPGKAVTHLGKFMTLRKDGYARRMIFLFRICLIHWQLLIRQMLMFDRCTAWDKHVAIHHAVSYEEYITRPTTHTPQNWNE